MPRGRELRREQVVRPARDEPVGTRLRRGRLDPPAALQNLLPRQLQVVNPDLREALPNHDVQFRPAFPRSGVGSHFVELTLEETLSKLGLGFGIARARRAEHLNAEPADLKDLPKLKL